MSEEEAAQEGNEDAHWTTGHEEFASDEAVSKYAGKFTSPYEAAKAGHELEKKLGSEFRIPDDTSKLSEEQQTALNDKLKELSGSAKSVDDYALEIPEALEGVLDKPTIEAVKAAALGAGTSPKALDAISKAYMDNLVSATNQQIEARNEALDAYKKELGSKASEVLGTVDSSGKTVELGTVQKACMAVSKELGLDYVDKEGNQRSQLWDDVEMTRLGDKVSLCKVFDLLYRERYAEGSPANGAGSTEEVSSLFDYPSMD